MGSTSKKNIASGATAVIRLVRPSPKSQIYAVKEFKKRDKTESEREYFKRMQNEYCISKTVSGHPHVVQTFDLVQDEHDRWCTVMEYVSVFYMDFLETQLFSRFSSLSMNGVIIYMHVLSYHSVLVAMYLT